MDYALVSTAVIATQEYTTAQKMIICWKLLSNAPGPLLRMRPRVNFAVPAILAQARVNWLQCDQGQSRFCPTLVARSRARLAELQRDDGNVPFMETNDMLLHRLGRWHVQTGELEESMPGMP